ncbi:MAG: hypothetical protein IJ274_12320, partial [Lachnospiraceae bacterium]|nr:hypothetical protein [Lachnospiraceae bacterium]
FVKNNKRYKGAYFMKKMALWEKILEILALVLLVVATIIKSQMGVEKIGYLVMLAFLGVMVYVMFLVAAFFRQIGD